MKYLSGFMIICICLILTSLTGVVSADSAQYDKIVNIYLNIDNGIITITSTEIQYGSAPNLLQTNEGFKGELVTADGSIMKTFTVWDPRVQFGDVISGNPDNPHIQGVVDLQNSAVSVVSFPFDQKVTEFRLYNSQEGTLLASVDLKPRIDSFFASYPNDPDNPALSGSKTLEMANAPTAGIPDPDAKASEQLLGLQAIGSGALLLLGGALASVRFLKKKPKSVLIVDNDRDTTEVIEGMLKIGGYISSKATSGEECLKKLDSAVPDLILLDIGMDPMDGWETLRRIKKNPATQDILVIMLTARRLTPKDVENYGIFIEDYVMKPVTFQDLKDTMMYVFARQQLIEEKIAAAHGAGIDRNELYEWARLIRVVDVNKRLWDILVRTYNLNEGIMQGAENEMIHAIKNIEGNFRDKEHQLERIQRSIGSGVMM